MGSGNMSNYIVLLIVVLLVFWRRSRNQSAPRLILAGGWLMLIPLPLVMLGMIFSLASLSQTGLAFIVPPTWEIAAAIAIGIVLGCLMLYHTNYEKKNDGLVYTKPNTNFKYVLIAIIVLRLALSQYLQTLSQSEFLILTFTIALVYIGIWRIGSFVKYRLASSAQPNHGIDIPHEREE